MTDSNNELVKEWYKFSMRDFASANTLNEHMHPKPLEIICYLSQQSAEKMLKGYLVSISIEPPRIHDLQHLTCEDTGRADFRRRNRKSNKLRKR